MSQENLEIVRAAFEAWNRESHRAHAGEGRHGPRSRAVRSSRQEKRSQGHVAPHKLVCNQGRADREVHRSRRFARRSPQIRGAVRARRSRRLLSLRDTARAMSQENVELYHRCVDAFNRRDLSAFLALMDEEVEAVSRLVAIEGGLTGHEGIRRWWKSWFDVWPDYKIELVKVRDLGDTTLAALRALGHGAGSDVPFEDTAWQLARWRRGKCVVWRVFNNRDQALEAAGLS